MESLDQIIKRVFGEISDVEYILTKEEEEACLKNFIKRRMEDFYKRINRMAMLMDVGGDRYEKMKFEAENPNKIEIENEYKRVNRIKTFEIEDLKIKEARLKNIMEIKKKYDSMGLFEHYKLSATEILKRKKRELVLTEDVKKIVRIVCFFLSKDILFEKHFNGDLSKGLMLLGKPGIGKTFTIKCISDNPVYPIALNSVIDAHESIRITGEYKMKISNKIYIDDVGAEKNTVNHYGNKVLWFQELIETLDFNNFDFSKLIISSNLNVSGFGEMYGFRTESRIHEHFNIFELDGVDFRKQK